MRLQRHLNHAIAPVPVHQPTRSVTSPPTLLALVTNFTPPANPLIHRALTGTTISSYGDDTPSQPINHSPHPLSPPSFSPTPPLSPTTIPPLPLTLFLTLFLSPLLPQPRSGPTITHTIPLTPSHRHIKPLLVPVSSQESVPVKEGIVENGDGGADTAARTLPHLYKQKAKERSGCGGYPTAPKPFIHCDTIQVFQLPLMESGTASLHVDTIRCVDTEPTTMTSGLTLNCNWERPH